MKERPILFSAPMIRALLAGKKTQTRRIVKWSSVQSQSDGRKRRVFGPDDVLEMNELLRLRQESPLRRMCPYGQIGDWLWVRECFSYTHDDAQGFRDSGGVWYWADGNPARGDWTRPKPSIHMPRWASRITLEITDVRVERLQDISEEDAKAEGTEPFRLPVHPARESLRHVDGYAQLWDSINGAGSWDANPWVWVVCFKRIP